VKLFCKRRKKPKKNILKEGEGSKGRQEQKALRWLSKCFRIDRNDTRKCSRDDFRGHKYML